MQVSDDDDNDNCVSLTSSYLAFLPCIAVFMLSVAVYALGCLMVGFWMFGGMFLGFYFTFASAHAFRDLALVKCFGVLSATFATAISTHL